MSRIRPWIVLAWMCAGAGPLLAEPPVAAFLTPESFSAAPQTAVAIRLKEGPATTAKAVTWPTDQVDWLFVRAGGDQTNRHDVRPAKASDDFISVPLDHAGLTVIGINRRPRVLDITGQELRDFTKSAVTTEAAAGIQPLAADAKLRVRRVESSVMLVRTAGSAEDNAPSALAGARTGQRVEIRPLMDPSATTPGGDLPFWVYVNGEKKAGVKVQATNVTTGKTTSVVSAGGGNACLTLDTAGVWRLEAHDLVSCDDKKIADWTLYSATLSFEVKGGAQ